VASESAYAPLPDRSTWRFDRISIEDPDRASALELLGTSEQLLDAVAAAFEHAVLNGRVRFGREHAEDARGGCRAVIQFHVGAALFDWFFNGRSGYRAHFWADPLDGIAFNDQMVSLIHAHVQVALPDSFIGCDLIGKFEGGAKTVLGKEVVLESLVPALSKLWWCARRIDMAVDW
jgi:hypothetical protein